MKVIEKVFMDLGLLEWKDVDRFWFRFFIFNIWIDLFILRGNDR